MQVFCVGFTDDYVLEVNLQILKPLGADFDRINSVGKYFSQNHAGYSI